MTSPQTNRRRDDFAADQLPPIPGGWQTKTVRIGEDHFKLTLPQNADALLEDSLAGADTKWKEPDPYWAHLWPAALPMSRFVMSHDWRARSRSGCRVLEIGAGIGLAAATSGLDVTFSDYEPVAIEAALGNAHQNGLSAKRLLPDWNDPVHAEFSVILGCDVVYEPQNHEPILALLDTMLESDGVCWIGGCGRQHVSQFCEMEGQRRFCVRLFDQNHHTLEQPVFNRFQLITLQHNESSVTT